MRLLVATMVALLVPAGAAEAAAIYMDGPTIVVQAAPGEPNRVAVTRDLQGSGGPAYLVTDAGAPVTAGGGCFTVGPNAAQCTTGPGYAHASLRLTLADGRDVAEVNGDLFTVRIDMGAGADELVLDRSSGVVASDSNPSTTAVDLGPGADVLFLRGILNDGHLLHTGIGCCPLVQTELDGGDGADLMTILGEPRTVHGGEGPDVIRMPDARLSHVFGDDGDDQLHSDALLFGGPGNDVLRHGTLDVNWYGKPDNVGEFEFSVTWFGGDGDDDIHRAGENVDCGAGTDTLRGGGGWTVGCEIRVGRI